MCTSTRVPSSERVRSNPSVAGTPNHLEAWIQPPSECPPFQTKNDLEGNQLPKALPIRCVAGFGPLGRSLAPPLAWPGTKGHFDVSMHGLQHSSECETSYAPRMHRPMMSQSRWNLHSKKEVPHHSVSHRDPEGGPGLGLHKRSLRSSWAAALL